MTAGLVLIYLWTNFADIGEKQDTVSPQKPVSCKLTQLCNFCRQLSGPFCHLSPQQPFQEGGNYQSTPLLLSTTHQTHGRNETKTFLISLGRFNLNTYRYAIRVRVNPFGQANRIKFFLSPSLIVGGTVLTDRCGQMQNGL